MLQSGFRILSPLILTTAHGPGRKILLVANSCQELSCAKRITNLFLTFHHRPLPFVLPLPSLPLQMGLLNLVVSQRNSPQESKTSSFIKRKIDTDMGNTRAFEQRECLSFAWSEKKSGIAQLSIQREGLRSWKERE